MQAQRLLPRYQEKEGPVFYQEPAYLYLEHRGPLDHHREVRKQLEQVVKVQRQLPHWLEPQGQVLPDQEPAHLYLERLGPLRQPA